MRDDVRVLGQLDELETVLQASDLFFLPELAESFGLAALEAQACGCPVIGYQAGGLPEVVVDGETGILCPAGEDVCLGSAGGGAARPTASATWRCAGPPARNAERFATGPIVDRYEKALCCLINAGGPCDADSVADCVRC